MVSVHYLAMRKTPPDHVRLIGDRIRKRREALGMQQNELAKEASVSPSAVSQWESPRDWRTGPSTESLIKAAKALRCRVSDLTDNPDDDIKLVVTDPDEISLVDAFRRLATVNPHMQRMQLQLLLESARGGKAPKTQDDPPKGRRVRG